MENLVSIVTKINDQLWGPPMVTLLVGFGIVATIYLGFPQFRRLGQGIKLIFADSGKQKNDKGSMTSFQSLATSLASQIGTGNIGGVATAIVSGGPGAIFWMWVSGVVGMATIAVEATLAQKYRQTRNGDLVGGPAYYIHQGFKNRGHAGIGKILSAAFAVLLVIALGFVGNMVQSNSIVGAIDAAFNVPPILIGLVIAFCSALIILGGISRIAKFAEMVVPVMAAIYIVGAIAILFKFNDMIIPVFTAIFQGAFSSQAVLGGTAGYAVRQAIRYGIARGLFANEAGMGSTPNSHAVANVQHPVQQGLVAMVGVFFDTFFICTATALIVLITGAQNSNQEGVMITMAGFESAFGDFGAKFLAIALVFFAFTTIVGWYYFGEGNVKFLTGGNKNAIRIYQVMAIAFIFFGSFLNVELVWQLADMFNGLMVIPNIIGLFFLVRESKELFKDYDDQLASGKVPTYHYEYETIEKIE